MNKKVLLGMSGGIDSSVAALKLKDQGFDVTGVTFLFSGFPQDSDLGDGAVKELAQAIGIAHHTVDLRDAFDELVVTYFKKSYFKGRTPFPCAVCNPQLKFARLVELANQLNCQYISTGHYVQVTENKNIKYISEGTDPEKDQSFFLWGIEREVISRLVFPLGSSYKKEVRQFASERSLHYLTQKRESLGVCFISGSDYRQFLTKEGVATTPGHFIDSSGNVLGEHKGIIYYTIGQRRGLNLQVNRPLFVIEIRPETNEIVLGDYNAMYRTRIFLHNVRFVAAENMDLTKTYKVRIRYRLQENECRIKFHGKQKAEIELLDPVAMVAPGQTAVIYEEGRVLGGGFIEGSE